MCLAHTRNSMTGRYSLTNMRGAGLGKAKVKVKRNLLLISPGRDRESTEVIKVAGQADFV